MYRDFKIGVAVPAYNEEKLIGRTIAEVPRFVDRIYAVDDASTDKTRNEIEKSTDKRVLLIKHDKNEGVGGSIVSAFMQGVNEVDVLAVMAGDNQMDPEDLPALLDPIVDGKVDFTKGDRFTKEYNLQMSAWRRFGTILLTYLTRIAVGYWYINDPQNGYVAISSKALKKIDLCRLYKGYAFENDMLLKAKVADLKVINVPVKIRYNIGERSKINYPNFIFKTSRYLLHSFFWRIREERVAKGRGNLT